MYKIYIICCFFILNMNIYSYADVFTNKVTVEANANTVQKAKEIALNNGRLEALKNTLYNITIKDYYQAINNLITLENSYLFEKSVKISNENIANKSYSAEITFTFNPQTIYKFLEEHDIEYVISKGLRYLIIPHYLENGKETSSLLETSEQWHNIWQKTTDNDYLSSFIYYSNNKISFLNNISVNINIIKEIKENLNIDNIFSVVLENMGDTYSLTIIDHSSNVKTTHNQIYSLYEAKNISIQKIEYLWKRKIIERNLSQELNDTFYVETKDFDKWISIEQKLYQIETINNIQILEIGSKYLKINIKQKENINDFKNTLSSYCILLDISLLSLELDPECMDNN
jgi:hypothetical protein